MSKKHENYLSLEVAGEQNLGLIIESRGVGDGGESETTIKANDFDSAAVKVSRMDSEGFVEVGEDGSLKLSYRREGESWRSVTLDYKAWTQMAMGEERRRDEPERKALSNRQ